jgi:2-hydroxychromene-2-carboxylate isomerase/alkylhydroperoxidase family enzyme
MPELQFWFDFASTYSYVAAERVEGAAAAAGVRVLWRPFLLGPIFTAQQGIKDSPFNVNPARGRHMWRDLERLTARYGIPWRRPSAFPRSGLLAARVVCAAGDAPWVPELCRAVFRAGFAEDRDIGDPGVVAGCLAAVGQDAAALLARAGAPEVKQLLKDRTAEAARLGLFGAPSLLADGELFFGQDRLEDAVAFAARPPSPRPAPRIPYLPADVGEPADLVAAVRARRGGALLILDRLLLRSPPLAAAWNAYLGAIRGALALDARLRELAICAVALLNGADYELHHHAGPFRGAGGTDAQLEALRASGGCEDPAGPFDARERAVLRLAAEMTRRVAVSDAAFEGVRSVLGDRATLELVAVVATYNMVSRFLVALGIEREG